jgi:hypothetical protein
MAKTDDGRPAAQSLGDMFEELKRDGLAWAAAERSLLKARVNSGVKRVELAAILVIGALIVTIAGVITLVNVLVQSLSPSLGPIVAGLIVGLALLLAGALLIAWVRSLLRPTELKGRTLSTAKIIWSALDEPH